MKPLMKDMWLYLKDTDWNDQNSAKTVIVGRVIAWVGSALLFAIGVEFGFDAFIAVFLFLFFGMIYLALTEEETRKEKREQELADARRYNPENVFGDVKFVVDEKLGDRHFK